MANTYVIGTRYFEVPKQVRWRLDDETMAENVQKWFYGIAYRDELICGCCGGITETDEALEIQELPWLDISQEIRGVDTDEELDPDWVQK